MKFLIKHSSSFNEKEKIIEIKSLKDFINFAKKQKHSLIIDIGGERIAFDFKKEYKDLDGIIEIYDDYREWIMKKKS